MTFTASDIDEAVENGDGWYEAVEALEWKPGTYDVPGIGTLVYVTTVVDQEDRELIFTVDGRTFRKNGYYESYSGSSWDGSCEQVESLISTPRLVTVG